MHNRYWFKNLINYSFLLLCKICYGKNSEFQLKISIDTIQQCLAHDTKHERAISPSVVSNFNRCCFKIRRNGLEEEEIWKTIVLFQLYLLSTKAVMASTQHMQSSPSINIEMASNWTCSKRNRPLPEAQAARSRQPDARQMEWRAKPHEASVGRAIAAMLGWGRPQSQMLRYTVEAEVWKEEKKIGGIKERMESKAGIIPSSHQNLPQRSVGGFQLNVWRARRFGELQPRDQVGPRGVGRAISRGCGEEKSKDGEEEEEEVRRGTAKREVPTGGHVTDEAVSALQGRGGRGGKRGEGKRSLKGLYSIPHVGPHKYYNHVMRWTNINCEQIGPTCWIGKKSLSPTENAPSWQRLLATGRATAGVA